MEDRSINKEDLSEEELQQEDILTDMTELEKYMERKKAENAVLKKILKLIEEKQLISKPPERIPGSFNDQT